MDVYNEYKSTSLFKNRGRSNNVNYGSSCYFNAVLSSLSNCLGLSAFLLTNGYLKTISPKNREHPEFGFLMSYISTLIGLFEKDQTISPKSLFKKFLIFSKFQENVQQDAHESLLSFLNILHIATSTKLSDFQIGPCETKIHKRLLESKSKWIQDFKEDYSIITHLFFGQIAQKFSCNTCKTKTFTYEPFVDLSISINAESVTLYDLLNTFFLKQKVTKNCETCKKSKTFSKISKIIKLPKYLIINLKRFTNDSKKIKKCIMFSSDLEMSDYTLPCSGSVEYDLVSTINHTGDSAFGHYYTVNKTFDGNWVKIDDDVTEDIRAIDVCSPDVYILVYELKD